MARAVQRDHLIDGDAIANLGWRQGSFPGPKLAKLAREHAPRTALADRADLLVVSSHDLPPKVRRLIAEWLAKRYIRAAFPTAFDQRWRATSRAWQTLLKKHSEWIQGVYLRLSTLDEFPEGTPYRCHLMLAVAHEKRGGPGWARG